MAPRHAIPILAALSLILLAGALAGGSLAALAFALGATWFPLALIALGTARAPRGVRYSLLGLAALTTAVTVALLASAPGGGSGRWLMLGGLGLLPLAWVVTTYALDRERGRG